MSSLVGGDMEEDHVSCPQGHCPAAFVIVLFVVLHLLLVEQISLPMDPPNAFR